MKRGMMQSVGALIFVSVLGVAGDFTGSIKAGMFESKRKELAQVKVSMIQAIRTAKKRVDGRVIKAKLDKEDGYLVYEIKILPPRGKKVKVIVDPVTAKILKEDRDD